MLFRRCEGAEERASGGNWSSAAQADTQSYRNPEQARATMQILDAVLAHGDGPTCALLTPYNGQVRLLTSLLQARHAQLLETGAVVISTVDGFQGKEADFVIFSTVRCNAAGRLGFVSDARRMNVALTRARRGLVVVGSAQTLRNDANWRAWLSWLASHAPR